MQLARLAYLNPREVIDDGTGFRVDDVEIVTWSRPEAGVRLVSASVRLAEMPSSHNGLVEIPQEPRRRAERALELTAGLLTITRGDECTLSSPNLVVALRPESDEDRAWLSEQREMVGFARAIAEPAFPLRIDMELSVRLGDRADGVALLAEAVSNRRMLGRFRETVRVFERGFAASSNQLVAVLAEFLEQRPALGFTKEEVKEWIGRIRGRVVHADRLKNEPALEADVRPLVPRMVLAAYEVVLNKAEWGRRSSSRRDLWTPRAGALDSTGRSVFIEQHALEPPLESRLFDQFGAYPIHLGTAGLTLPAEYWPRKGPHKTRTEKFDLKIVPRAELELTRT